MQDCQQSKVMLLIQKSFESHGRDCQVIFVEIIRCSPKIFMLVRLYVVYVANE